MSREYDYPPPRYSETARGGGRDSYDRPRRRNSFDDHRPRYDDHPRDRRSSPRDYGYDNRDRDRDRERDRPRYSDRDRDRDRDHDRDRDRPRYSDRDRDARYHNSDRDYNSDRYRDSAGRGGGGDRYDRDRGDRDRYPPRAGGGPDLRRSATTREKGRGSDAAAYGAAGGAAAAAAGARPGLNRSKTTKDITEALSKLPWKQVGMAAFEAGAMAAASQRGQWNAAKAGKVATSALGAGFMAGVNNKNGGGSSGKKSGGGGGSAGKNALMGLAGEQLLKQFVKKGSKK